MNYRNSDTEENSSFIKQKIVKVVIAVVLLIVTTVCALNLFETVGAGEIVIIQYPSGSLARYNSPGIKFQGFGSVTRYKKSFQYWFTKDGNNDGTIEAGEVDRSIKVRFNDGGHGQISGSCRIDLPEDEKSMLLLHTRYGSQEGVESALVRTVIEKAVYFTGPLMSSKESSSTRRNDLLTFIADQAENGVYKTRQREVRTTEEGADTSKIVTIVEVLKDKSGLFLRQEKSPFNVIHIGFGNLSINALDYDATVEKQIRAQQALTMQVQTAMARAKTAEQQVFTTQKEGEAKAAEAKWKQEAIKAQAVTAAEQELAVQALQTKKAAAFKEEQILIGEGIAQRKRLEFNANGALEVKMDTWLKAQKYMWDAFGKYQGNMVPSYQVGGSGSGSNNALQFMELMSMKAAKDLSLDMTAKK